MSKPILKKPPTDSLPYTIEGPKEEVAAPLTHKTSTSHPMTKEERLASIPPYIKAMGQQDPQKSSLASRLIHSYEQQSGIGMESKPPLFGAASGGSREAQKSPQREDGQEEALKREDSLKRSYLDKPEWASTTTDLAKLRLAQAQARLMESKADLSRQGAS